MPDEFHERNNLFDMFTIQVCQLETNKKMGFCRLKFLESQDFVR